MKAVLFRKESSLSSDSYQVSVINYKDSLDDDDVGNVCTVDTDHGNAHLDSSSTNFTWLSNNTLQIDYDKKLRTFIMEQKINDISIEYRPR